MSTETTPVQAPSTPAATPAPQRPKPTQNPWFFAGRVALTVLLLIVYHSTREPFLAWLTDAYEKLFGHIATPATLRVFAVTLLCACLAAVWWVLIRNDKRFHAPILITYILAAGDAAYGILETHTSDLLSTLTGGEITSYSPTFVAILATVVMEMILTRFVSGKWPHLASSYISGISVGILIKSPHVWPYVLCGLISITSKYVLRIGGRHLWNPTNFGVTMMLFLAGSHVASLSVQSGNEIWPVLVIWALGGLILYSLKRLHIPLVFVAAFIPLAFLRSALTGRAWQTELAPITWPMFQLFIFFMITDPKTTTRAVWSQCLVVVLVAIVETMLRLFEDVHSLYHSLFIVGPIANLVEIWYDSRHKPAARPGPA